MRAPVPPADAVVPARPAGRLGWLSQEVWFAYGMDDIVKVFGRTASSVRLTE